MSLWQWQQNAGDDSDGDDSYHGPMDHGEGV
jgi:hypothetical protein